MLYYLLSYCDQAAGQYPYNPLNQSCLQCTAPQVPSNHGCGCENQQIFDNLGVATCSATISCVINQPFSTQCAARAGEIACPDGQDGGFTAAGFHCGSLLYSDHTDHSASLCNAGVFIPQFQVCWPDAAYVLKDVAQKLCNMQSATHDYQVSNGYACQYLLNLCFTDPSACQNSDLYRNSVAQQVYLDDVQDTKYKPASANGNINVFNLSYSVSTASGEILMKSRLGYESLDFCSILEAGLNPVAQKIHRYHQVDQKERCWDFGLITRYLLHRKQQLIQRDSDPDNQILQPVQDFKFGSTFNKTCRVGHYNLQKFVRAYPEPLFITVYQGNVNKSVKERIVPFSYNNAKYLAIPLYQVSGQDVTFMNYFNFSAVSYSNRKADSMMIEVDSVTVSNLLRPQDIDTSPIFNRIITKLTSTQRSLHGFERQQNVVDFEYMVDFSNSNATRDMTVINAVFLVVFWFFYLIYGISQIRRQMGVNIGCSNAPARAVGYALTIMLLGVSTAFVAYIVFSYALKQADPAYYIAQGYDSPKMIRNALLISSVMFIVGEVCHVVFAASPLRFVIIDHGDAQFYYRRMFIANGLLKLVRAPAFSLLLTYIVVFVGLYALDLQYSSGFYTNQPHATKTLQQVPIFTVVVLVSHLAVFLVTQIVRFCSRQTAYDKFADCLTLSNCSVLVFDSCNSAFLVYGKTPFGDSDVSGLMMQRNLVDEAQSLTPRRGIHGRSAQSFRIYFNENCEEMRQMYEIAEEMTKVGKFTDNQCGKLQFSQNQRLENFATSIKVPNFDAQEAESIEREQNLGERLILKITQQPVRYTLKFGRIFDFNLATKEEVLVISDPTRNFSPRAADTGATLPGGLGGPLWMSKAFRYGRWWLDCLLSITVMNLIGYFSNNMALGIISGWAVEELQEWILGIRDRKLLGIGCGCCEGVLV